MSRNLPLNDLLNPIHLGEARFDVKCVAAATVESVARITGGELRAINRSGMRGRTMTLERLIESGEYIIGLQLVLDLDRQALLAVLIVSGFFSGRKRVSLLVGERFWPVTLQARL